MFMRKTQKISDDGPVLVYFDPFRDERIVGVRAETLRRYKSIVINSEWEREYLIRKLNQTIDKVIDKSLLFSDIDVRLVVDIGATTYMIDSEGVIMKGKEQKVLRPGSYLDLSEFLGNRR